MSRRPSPVARGAFPVTGVVDDHGSPRAEASAAADVRDRAVCVLLVEDDPLDRELFVAQLDEAGHDTTTCTSVEEALVVLGAARPHGGLDGVTSAPAVADVVLLDLDLPGLSGLSAVSSVQAAAPTVPLVVLTGHAPQELVDELVELGIHDFVPKDEAAGDRLDRAVRHAVRRSELQGRHLHAALHDHLTGLANRVLLGDRLSSAASIARRSRTLVALLYLDLDGFKPVNDAYGHDVGDRLLVEVGRRLRSAVRPSDTVARVGGDEFVVVLGEVGGPAEVDDVAHRVVRAIREPWTDPVSGEVRVDVTVGVAVSPAGPWSVDALIVEADRACLAGKRVGGSGVRWSDGGTIESAIERVGPGLRLGVVYQPILDRSGSVTGHEALARLLGDDGTTVAPDRFLQALHAAGFAAHVDLSIASLAVADARAHRLGDVSLNLAGETLRDDVAIAGFVERVGELAPSIVVELAERDVRVDARVARSLDRLRRAGIRLALDDFGAGSADLARLVDIDVDVVKLDRHFMRRLSHPDRTVPVLAGIIDVAHRLGNTVVVEGIERPDQLELALSVGADGWQGFLHARPRPLAELELDRGPR